MVAAYSRRNARESSKDIDTNDEHASRNVSRALLSHSTIGFGLFGPVTLRQTREGKEAKAVASLQLPFLVSVRHTRGAIFEFPSLSRFSPSLLLCTTSLLLAPRSRSSLLRALPQMLRKAPCTLLKPSLGFWFLIFPWNLLNFHWRKGDARRGKNFREKWILRRMARALGVVWRKEESHWFFLGVRI